MKSANKKLPNWEFIFIWKMRGLRGDFGKIDWLELISGLPSYLKLDKYLIY
jgi:hypothetical protein